MISGETSPSSVFNEPYPCEGCQHWDHCKEKLRSCESFYIYVTERGRLDLTKRIPDRDSYHRTFVKRRKPDMAWEPIVVVQL